MSPTKMLFINTQEHITKLEHELRAMLAGRAFVTRSDPEYLEFVSHFGRGPEATYTSR